jgi:hypothetical protein
MGNKKTSWLYIFILTLVPFSALHAQDSSFTMEITTRFIQRLTWTAGEHVLHYEVIIERTDENINSNVLQEFTAETFMEISLPPGDYRFRIVPYDLLNRPGASSAWVSFMIRPAFAPEIESFSPQVFTLRRNISEYVLNITGKNISQGAEIFLRRPGTAQTIHPAHTAIAQDGSTVTLIFSAEQMEHGIFLLHVINTSGLETSFGDLVVEPSSRREFAADVDAPIGMPAAQTHFHSLDILLGLNWTPLFEIPQFDEHYFDGATLRFGIISSNNSMFNIGFELSAAYYLFGLMLFENNFLLRTCFLDQRLFVLFRLGTGITLPAAGQSMPNLLDTKIVYANAGISVCWFFFGNFYIEAGANYSYKFAVENHFSLLRPMIGVGVRL